MCNIMRKPGGKKADGTTTRGQQVSLIAQENLKLSIFLFHHMWRCTFDWKVKGVHEDTVHLIAGQQGLKVSTKT